MMSGPETNPGKILELSGYYWKTCTLHAAVKLDLFTVLGDAQKSGDAVADEINGSEKGIIRLLNALCAMGLVVKSDGRYANTAASSRFLDSRSPEYVGYIMKEMLTATGCRNIRRLEFTGPNDSGIIAGTV